MERFFCIAVSNVAVFQPGIKTYFRSVRIKSNQVDLKLVPIYDRNEIEMMVEFICTAWSRLSKKKSGSKKVCPMTRSVLECIVKSWIAWIRAHLYKAEVFELTQHIVVVGSKGKW